MRHVAAAVCAAAILGSLAGAALGARQQLWFENLVNSPDYGGKAAVWNDPHASSAGALWIRTGSQPSLLAQDVDLRLDVNAPDGHGGNAWITLVTVLLSAPLGQVPAADNNWVGDARGDYSTFGSPGAFTDPSGQSYEIPNTNFAAGPGSYSMRLFAWTGTATTYAGAAAANEFVADSGIFSETVPYGGPMATAADLVSLPAMILARPLLPGDANKDGRVDINDLNAVLAHYDQSAAMTWATGDFNGDGRVDINDLNALLANYDKSAGSPAGVSAVPEPGGLSLLLAVLAILPACVRRMGGTRQ